MTDSKEFKELQEVEAFCKVLLDAVAKLFEPEGQVHLDDWTSEDNKHMGQTTKDALRQGPQDGGSKSLKQQLRDKFWCLRDGEKIKNGGRDRKIGVPRPKNK